MLIIASAEMPEPELFFVLMFTGAIFVAGLLISIFATASLKRKRSSKFLQVVAFVPLGCGTVIFAPFVFLLGSWILYWMLPQHVTTREEVTKEYIGTMYGGHEALVLKPDGTFMQIVDLPDKREFTKDGKWTLKDNYVELSESYVFYDDEHNQLLAEPRLIWGGQYRYYYGDKALIYDWESNHYTLKHK